MQWLDILLANIYLHFKHQSKEYDFRSKSSQDKKSKYVYIVNKKNTSFFFSLYNVFILKTGKTKKENEMNK